MTRRPGFAILMLLLFVFHPSPADARVSTVVLVLGDSLSAGYGIDPSRGWVALLERRLERRGEGYRVVNASISGDTTRGGVARLPLALDAHRPAVVIVELGGNDGLRGLDVAQMRANLSRMITLSRESGAEVLLVGMRIPPNYGRRYTEAFHAAYGELARKHRVALVPFMLDGVALDPALMQNDGVHPRVEGQPRILENIWPHLEPLL